MFSLINYNCFVCDLASYFYINMVHTVGNLLENPKYLQCILTAHTFKKPIMEEN